MTTDRPELVVNRERQRALYGVPLAERVHHLTRALGISQARLAATLGISPAMLSQLISARRVKIGDPAVLSRMMLLDERCAGGRVDVGPEGVDGLLAEVNAAGLQWREPRSAPDPDLVNGAGAPAPGPARAADGAAARPRTNAADALRAVATPARLVAAAAALAPSFPELAEVLRQAAGPPRTRTRVAVRRPVRPADRPLSGT
ncbi:XRE family transcriptional regulator [Pseudonocardia sp. T1-2H]|uniref:XRE family transcriptional regulator n=1 Tax=Pseudonocardia sp. T1-2H TaxID=3128899 RepID=UPI00310183B1